MFAFLLQVVLACTPEADTDVPSGDSTVPWSGELPPLREEIGPIRQWTPARAIVHLHSVWSHDACDGEPLNDDASYNEQCLADLRAGLCATSVDVAFLTDHPDSAASRDYEELFLAQEGDRWVERDSAKIALGQACANGQEVLWLPGIEESLTPVALDRQVADSPEANDAAYRQADAEGLAAMESAGATVINVHTEEDSVEWLSAMQDAGMVGTELFNLHAAFDPENRELLGLDPYGWMTEIAPFTSEDESAEPDLLVLAVLEEHVPSVAAWDALLARGPMTGLAGTDAHQNVLPITLRDGDRADSYRRMLRWFSNVLLVEAIDPDAAESAIRAGRAYVAFDILGVPDGFDFRLEAETGELYEMGSDSAPDGELVVECPTLSRSSPRGEAEPEITVSVLKDGAPWQEGCGSFATDGSGVYRVRVDLVPWHLREFLGDDPEPWLTERPWVYSNAIRVGTVAL